MAAPVQHPQKKTTKQKTKNALSSASDGSERPNVGGLPFLVKDVGQERREGLRLDLSLLPEAVQVEPEGEELLHCDHVRRQPWKPHLRNRALCGMERVAHKSAYVEFVPQTFLMSWPAMTKFRAVPHDSSERRSRLVRLGSAIDVCLLLAISTEPSQVQTPFQQQSHHDTIRCIAADYAVATLDNYVAFVTPQVVNPSITKRGAR